MSFIEEAIRNHESKFEPALSWYHEMSDEIWRLDTSRFKAGLRDNWTAKNVLTKFDLLEGLVLHIYRTFEQCVTEDIILLFAHDTTDYCRRSGCTLPKTVPREKAEEVIKGSKGHLEFGYYHSITKKAKQFLSPQANPFSGLPENCKKSITEFTKIRNHIAHESKRSSKEYRELLKDKKIVNMDMKPANFLLLAPGQEDQSQIVQWERKGGRKRFFQLYVDDFMFFSASVVGFLKRYYDGL